MMKKTTLKNKLLILTYVLSYLPSLFYGTSQRLNLGIFIERSTRLDYFFRHYTISASFIIYAYCLHYPTGIDRRVTRLILTLTILDFFHILLFSMRGFEISKIGIAFYLFILYEIKKKYG